MVSLRYGDMDRCFEEDEPIYAHWRKECPPLPHICFYPDEVEVEVEVDGERVTK